MKMGTNYLAILGVTTMTTVMSCSSAKKEYASYELYPVRSGNLVEMEYAPGLPGLRFGRLRLMRYG